MALNVLDPLNMRVWALIDGFWGESLVYNKQHCHSTSMNEHSHLHLTEISIHATPI